MLFFYDSHTTLSGSIHRECQNEGQMKIIEKMALNDDFRLDFMKLQQCFVLSVDSECFN